MVFIELAPFRRRLDDLLSDDAYRALQAHLVERPDAGAVMRGTGGFRKVRWAEAGRGKSGGVRVVYLHRPELDRVYLAAIYAKGERDDLSQAERNALRDVVARLR